MRPDSKMMGYLLAACVFATPVLHAQSAGNKAQKGGQTGAAGSFQLAALDNFESGTDGWPKPGVQRTCSAGNHQLGVAGIYGSGSVDSVSKTYAINVEHSSVRVQATLAFLDNWQGETASLSVDGVTVWSDTWHHCPRVFSSLCSGVNVCGDSETADRLGRSIDIIVPHNSESLTLTFQTSLGSVSDNASLLVDDIRISSFRDGY